ncbi:PAS domain-containing sensor histidine kinase [Leeia sp. TBRC 13508]|uniref:histidine kinase n=1 Tax=Leeia speluncae TaxID=2884804 RepID=A0ABS8D365_9NEIS|nr:PAS domain-containing sensor histidine kinase [Leeia speluncae]MCB6182615.1 PAS domain-containing sensor histidine kinase [Leeia speluncae]
MSQKTWRIRTRWLWAMPNMVIMLFLASIIGFVVLLRTNESMTRQEGLIEDVLWQEQALRLQLQGLQNQLTDLGRTLSSEDLPPSAFQARVQFLQNENPELITVTWLPEDALKERYYPQSATAIQSVRTQSTEVKEAMRRARLSAHAAYSPPLLAENKDYLEVVAIPFYKSGHLNSYLLGTVSLRQLLKHHVPWWIARKHQITIEDISGKVLAARFEQHLQNSDFTHALDLDPFYDGVRLRATSYQASSSQWQNIMIVVVGALAIIMLWSLWALRLHMKERKATEQALRQEMGMRRAMEDSMVSGMRAMDMEGNIIYVNKAFCNMVGLSAKELIGHRAPMPYWPAEESEACRAVYRDVLINKTPSKTGYTLRFMRKSGERFDVRVYYSPLIDGSGKQTGWMGSLYDITELKREREALKASHERFMTVLNGLDSAVSVSDKESGELLFTNQNFRTRFALTENDLPVCVIPMLSRDPLPEDGLEGECWDEQKMHCYHLQRRETVWVDGRKVWLEISTDITDTRKATDREREQTERLQHSSRLISMGEMASSLAHELNQPLAAISSYSTGCQNLLDQPTPNLSLIKQAIEKTAQQAQRAGQIIRGIRDFVQRKAPQLVPCQFDQLIENVLTLQGADLRHTGVKVKKQLSDLPEIQVDKVMIEQVLFNLTRNAVEAMSNTSADKKVLTISTQKKGTFIECQVKDHGCGLSETQKQQLFMPFYSTKQQGLGMGLNICRSIIEHHHGQLWVEDNEGGGCCFTFTIPITTSQNASN